MASGGVGCRQGDLVHFINTNNIFNVNVDRNNASNILFTKFD